MIDNNKKFIKLALLAAQKSDDPNTKVGCIIVKNNRIIGKGYNHFLKTKGKEKFPTSNSKEVAWIDTKYPYIVHAEMDAICNAKESIKGSSLYVTLAPCNECAKNLVNLGIKEVYFLDDKYKDVDSFIAGKLIFKNCGIKITQIKL